MQVISQYIWFLKNVKCTSLSAENIYLGFQYSFVQTYILIFMQLLLLSLIICKPCVTWKKHEFNLERVWNGQKTLCEHFVSGTLSPCFYICSILGDPKVLWKQSPNILRTQSPPFLMSYCPPCSSARGFQCQLWCGRRKRAAIGFILKII